MSASHERILVENGARAGSEGSFGIVFAVLFALNQLFPLIHGGDIRLWALVGTLVFGSLAWLWPSLFAFLNRL
jgi:hypothetical protein